MWVVVTRSIVAASPKNAHGDGAGTETLGFQSLWVQRACTGKQRRICSGIVQCLKPLVTTPRTGAELALAQSQPWC